MASSCGLGTTEETLGRDPVSLRTQHRVNQLPLFVNGSMQINPTSTHLHIRLIHVLTATHLAFPSAPDLVGQQGRKPGFPVPHRFMTKLMAKDQKHLHQIAQAQFEQEPE